MRISKVYTRSGDDGQTGLASGKRISKASLRVCAYGEVDELNSFLGLTRCSATHADLQQLLPQLQHMLFVLGADLATPFPDADGGKSDPVRRITQADVESLEKTIDRHNDSLPPLKEFILPGGNQAAAWLHVARAVARRAERTVVRLAEAEKLNPQAIIYLNRLSDLLFVLARVANRQDGGAELFAQFH